MNRPPGRCSASWNVGPNWSKAKSSPPPKMPIIDHQGTPLADHIAAYLLKLEAEGASPMHRDNVRRALHRLAADCQFKRLGNLARESLERWLVSQEKAGMGARTRNTYRAAAVAFCNWCIETGRLLSQSLRQGGEGRRRRRPSPATSGADRRRTDRGSWTWHAAGRCWIVMTVYRGKRQGRSRYAKLRAGSATPVGTARAGTGLDLQDAGADRTPQRRIGFDYRGASGPRRRHALL